MSSKYDLENYLEINKDTGLYDYLPNGGFIDKLKALTFKNKIEVSQRELDEIALDIYGNEELWWVIAIYNDIINPTILETSILYVPSRIDVEKLFLSYSES